MNYKLISKRCVKKMKLHMKPREERLIFSCSKQPRQMLRHSWRNKKESKKRRTWIIKLLSISERRIRQSSKNNKRLNDLERRKSVRFRD